MEGNTNPDTNKLEDTKQENIKQEKDSPVAIDKTIVASDPYSKVMSEKKDLPPHNVEAFAYLFMFISLYLVSTSAAMILHYSAEKFFPIIGTPGSNSGFPDVFSGIVLSLIGSGYGVISPLVPHLAILIVIYPFFVILFLWVNKRTIEEPLFRKIDIRKLLFASTLVVTFIYMMQKFISLVINLLTGNGSLNFLSHFLITVLINLTIFLYCFYELRKDKKLNA